MIASESFIETVVERARAYVNDPDVDAKYTDDWIVRHVLMPSMVDVLARLNLSQDNPVICRADFTLSSTDRYYQLPPCIGEVLEIAVYDASFVVTEEAKPRHFLNPIGSGWRLEGNILVVEPLPADAGTTRTFSVSYISNGSFAPHLSEDGGTLEQDADGNHRVWLDHSPDKGALDRRPNAYAGQVIRLLPTTPGPVEERLIGASGYEGGRYYVDVRVPFTYQSAQADTLRYELAPQGHECLYDAIAMMVGLRLGSMARLSDSTMKRMEVMYRTALKTIKDNLHSMQQRRPKHWAKDTRDNPTMMYLL